MASAMSYDVIAVNSDKKDEVEVQRLIAKRKVDAVMLNRELDPAVIDVLDQFQTPYILLGFSEDTSVNQVDTDTVKACEELVQHLIHKGIRKIAYIGEYGCFTVNKRRVKGFINACEKNNIKKRQIFTTQNVASQDEVDNAVKSALKTCECIIANDDLMCLRIMNALGRMGVSIPGQIKLASMYHSYLLDISVPRITSINHKSQDVGENAAKMLINILENDDHPKRGNKLWIDYEIILSESTLFRCDREF
jgi:DNA-binding LacI/PurR family transcriptional regulator